LIGDTPVRAYHCTRLLPHEIESVRTHGLRPLTLSLLEDRIRGALDCGAITQVKAEMLLHAHVFADDRQKHREGQVCLVLSSEIFRRDPDGCAPLLSTWGGEGFYMSRGWSRVGEHIAGLGLPTVVVAHICLGSDWRLHRTTPSLHLLFVGVALGLSRAWADVFYQGAISPEQIEAIWQAGNPEYVALGPLPRA